MSSEPHPGEHVTREEALDRINELEDRVHSLEQLTDALLTQNKELKRLLAGSTGEFAALNIDNMPPLHDRLKDVEESVGEHDEKFQMFVTESGKSATPDERAMHLRQTLLNRAHKQASDITKMTRESAALALGGDLHKGSVLDAMRRAADGTEAKIDGASDLQPVDGVTFHRGGTVGSDGDPEQSVLMLDLETVTAKDVRQDLTSDGDEHRRQNLTTGETEQRGSR